MAKFLTGNSLNAEIEKILEEAKSQIILISPYIKLHDRYISSLKTKIDNPEMELIIVFGKNEEDLTRSMKKEDFDFFKEFPNIEIRYEKRLHAKYYCNESCAILTSMNLYSFSQDNNIEAGVMTKATLVGNIARQLVTGEQSFDDEATTYFYRVIEQSKLLFKKEPQYESGFFSNKYKESIIIADELSEFFSDKNKLELSVPRKQSIPITNEKIMVNRGDIGYCIRTGKPIPFNPKKPMSDKALESWDKYKDENYPEKYCHFSGEESNGETSYCKPILRKNWNKAKETYQL